jgi:signal transduction histidine kinase
VSGDAASLRRLALILLDNAINYTPRGGTIVVRAGRCTRDGADWARFEVEDTGPGIAPGEQARVFDRFYRGTDARRLNVEGAGLGLAIARAIVLRHQGSIEIANRAEGQGALVRVELPQARATRSA